MLTKSDQELNHLAATGLLHWTVVDGFFINSQKQRRCAVSEYHPISNRQQYEEIASKMQARDYQLTVREVNGKFEVEFSKYGEHFSFTHSSQTRAGTIAALVAYKQLD